MKVCPRCGYVDYHWRPIRWRLDVEYIRMDLFKELKPRLAEKLLSGWPVVEDRFYVYRSPGRKLFVERVPKHIYLAAKHKSWHSPFETVNHRVDIHQLTLDRWLR